ncbi:hypothetical protein DRH29_04185 [candidate division Kazan bacterium]|uniref:Uncharacterized protein n=1 Tax=candidate division Kazan bacterium TaxID=2202143 RepID=A0A420ZBT6_UNCK3|nr:MAG: hypothetical protein DRH29_04185 [candidate division Kazan bacterium]
MSGIIVPMVSVVSVVGIVQRGRILRKGIMGEYKMNKKFKKDEITLCEFPRLFRRRAFLMGNSINIVDEMWNIETEMWDDISSIFVEIEDINKLLKWLWEIGEIKSSEFCRNSIEG